MLRAVIAFLMLVASAAAAAAEHACYEVKFAKAGAYEQSELAPLLARIHGARFLPEASATTPRCSRCPPAPHAPCRSTAASRA